MSLFKLLVNHQKQDSFVNRVRRERFNYLQEKIESLIVAKGSIKILDIGGETDYWKHIGWHHENCTIYLLNLENAPGQEEIPGFVRITGTALELPFQYGDFDLIFSNSVIEHVGSYANQVKFAEEVKRVSDRYIIQTPSIWFPLEPHSLIPFFQFIPHTIRALFIMIFDINYFPRQKTYKDALAMSKSTLMFSKKRFSQLFPEADIRVEHLFSLTKSYTAIKI